MIGQCQYVIVYLPMHIAAATRYVYLYMRKRLIAKIENSESINLPWINTEHQNDALVINIEGRHAQYIQAITGCKNR